MLSLNSNNRHRILFVYALFTLYAILPDSATAQQLTPTEIVRRANDLMIGTSSKGDITMRVERPTWSREVRLKTWSLGTNYYMILITAPAEDKNQSFLKRNNEMWNWMPSLSRVIRIPPSMMGQSWMGSDFTNNDLVDKNAIVDDYVHTQLGDETVDGYDCYHIQLIPKPQAAVVWGKVVVWISKKQFFLLRAEYYDEDGALVNRESLTDIRRMGDREMPTTLTMTPAATPGNKTIMHFNKLEFNPHIGVDFFSQENMKSLR